MKKLFCLALSISLLLVTCFAGISAVQAKTLSLNYIVDGGFDTTESVVTYNCANIGVWQKDNSDTATLMTETDTLNKYLDFKGNGLWYVIGGDLEEGKTYRVSFQLKKNESDNNGAFEIYLCDSANRYVNDKKIMSLLGNERNVKFNEGATWTTFYCDFTYDKGDEFFGYNTLRFYQYGAAFSIDNISIYEYNYGLIDDGGIDYTTSLNGVNATKTNVWGYGYSWKPEISTDGDNKVIHMLGENNGNDMLTYVLGDKIKVGSTYQLTFKIKATIAGKQFQFYLAKASDISAHQGTAQKDFYPQSTNWESITHTFTVADAAYNTLRFQANFGYEFLIDDIALVEVVEEEIDEREKIVDGGFDNTESLSGINASKPDVWSYLYTTWSPLISTLDGNKVLMTDINKDRNNLFTYCLGDKLNVGSTYKLTFKVKAESTVNPIIFYLTQNDGATYDTKYVMNFNLVSTEWTTYTHVFTVLDDNANTLRFETKKGELYYFDDFSLVDTSITEVHTVTTWVSNSKYGDVIGAGTVADGEYLNLNAVPTQNGKFTGWYNSKNELLSTEVSYVFVPDKDMDVFAKFSNVSSAEANNPRAAVGNFKSNAIRAVAGNQALRFKYILAQSDLNNDYNGYKIVEYGYIASELETMLENGDSALSLNSNYVSAAAYVTDYEGAVIAKDVYFEKDEAAGTKTVSVALKNIGYSAATKETDYSYYSKEYVVRSYTKYQNANGEETVIYGTQYIASVFDTMYTILSVTEDDAINMGYDWTTVQEDQAAINALLASDENMQNAYNELF